MPAFVLALLLLFSSTLALAQTAIVRPFPPESRKGLLIPPVGEQVQIGSVLFYKAASLQIRNTQNMIVMPAALQDAVPIRFQLDAMGQVWRIWILTAAELAAPDPQP